MVVPMWYTISDFQNSYAGRVRCIAGAGGLSRPISEVALLDYELVPGLKNTYQRVNFYENQLVLTSFLYARESPHLITEAVKYLIAQGTSGLAVRNVFHIPIPEQALRYANARNYPLFLVTDDTLYFDHLVYEVNHRARELAATNYVQKTIDAILLHAEDGKEVRKRAEELNPSFKPEFIAVHLRLDEALTVTEFSDVEHTYLSSELAACENVFACHREGIVMIVSADTEQELDARKIERELGASRILPHLGARLKGLGISSRRFGLEGIGGALLEAIQASRFSERAEGEARRYDELGMYRTILPFIGAPQLERFASGVLTPLREHDSEHGTSLEMTLQSYIACGRSIDETARELGQHANTIRYRLDRIGALTGLDFRRVDDADQLAQACRIAVVGELFPAYERPWA